MTDLFAALDATWPAADTCRAGPFLLRDGAGGGKRVSAATLDGAFDEAALDALNAPLFQVRPGDEALDAALQARGYAIVDPSVLMTAPVDTLAAPPPPVFLLPCWPPLAIQRHLWAGAQTGPERLAVMARAQGPRTSFILRQNDSPAGVAFVALHQGIAMLHALHVEPGFRRQGVARSAVQGMAHWAAQNGAHTFALAVTTANASARALYSGLGMVEADRYHYREKRP